MIWDLLNYSNQQKIRVFTDGSSWVRTVRCGALQGADPAPELDLGFLFHSVKMPTIPPLPPQANENTNTFSLHTPGMLLRTERTWAGAELRSATSILLSVALRQPSVHEGWHNLLIYGFTSRYDKPKLFKHLQVRNGLQSCSANRSFPFLYKYPKAQLGKPLCDKIE